MGQTLNPNPNQAADAGDGDFRGGDVPRGAEQMTVTTCGARNQSTRFRAVLSIVGGRQRAALHEAEGGIPGARV